MKLMCVTGFATLVMLVSCMQYFAASDWTEWNARDYQPVVASAENGGLRAISVADSAMEANNYDLGLFDKHIFMDSTTFRVNYTRVRLAYDGGVTVYVAKANFTVMRVFPGR